MGRCMNGPSELHRLDPQPAQQEDGRLVFDLTGYEMEGYNKFIPYYLFPDPLNTVFRSAVELSNEVSVGSNPWVDGELKPTIWRTICEAMAAGGHAARRRNQLRARGYKEARKSSQRESLKSMKR